MRMADFQQRMPRRRDGHTTSVTIGGERFSFTANGRADGSLGEVFIQWGKQGTTGAGLMGIYADALSVGLHPVLQGLGGELLLTLVLLAPTVRCWDNLLPRLRLLRVAVAQPPHQEKRYHE